MWYNVEERLAIAGLWYNFLPSWWRSNYGLSFGEPFVFDADYRVELYRFMARTVQQRFPGLHIGSPDPQAQVVAPDFGNAITAAAAGCEVIYPVDNYPWNKHLPVENLSQLVVPDQLDDVFPYSEVKQQVAYLNRKLGKDVPVVWNSRGVLNDAVLIGGPSFLGELAENSALANHLLEYSNGMLTTVIKANHERFGYRDMVMLTNCTVMMVSPSLFARRLIDYDLKLYDLVTRQGQILGLHHCGSFEKYASTYRKIPVLSLMEIGWGSDLRTALDLFPEAVVQYILSSVFISTATRSEVEEKINEILEITRGNWHRFRLSMPDIEAGAPDENLNTIFECCKKAG